MTATRVLITHRHSVVRVAGRYVSGRPLDGRARTDARFLVAGTRALTPTGHASRWAMLPGWKRAAWRLGVPSAGGLYATAYAIAPALTDAGLYATMAAGTAHLGRRTVRGARVRRHTRTYVRPLARALAAQVGWPATVPAARWLYVDPDVHAPDYDSDPDTPRTGRPSVRARLARAVRLRTTRPDGILSGHVRVLLPDHTPDNTDMQRAVHRTVAAKLGVGLGDLDASWRMVGDTPHVLLRLAPRPPRKVSYADVAGAIASTSPAAPVLGIGSRGRMVSIDLDTDAPHLAVSCGSGAGKSVLLRTIIAQFLARSAQVIVCDPKRISQAWCRDLAGVTYCRTAEEMHGALVAMRAEVDRRNTVVDAMPVDSEELPDLGGRIVVVIEEQNVAMGMLTEWWQANRDKSDPKRSPALAALDYVLCTGRQVQVHVISVAQMFTVQAAGGNPAARENYGARILARATRNAWLMLAPECGPPFPTSSRTRGRMHLVIAGEATEVQSAFLTVAEARALAEQGTLTVPVTWLTPDPTREQATPSGQGHAGTPPPAAAEPRYTLADAARQPWCTLDYEALRKRRQRAAAWPAGRRRAGRETWTEAQLREALGITEDAA